MTPLFHPSLVNDPFDDPGIFIDFLFEKRAILFDIGEIRSLPPRKLLRVSEVFVSHAHIDHFIGFDHLVRITLGRGGRIRFFGPPGFLRQVGARLSAYTWNLVGGYPEFILEAWEVHPEGFRRGATFNSKSEFSRTDAGEREVPDGTLLDEETFRIRCVLLDHRIPSLAYTLEEKRHVNILKNVLTERGLAVGAWLKELKRLAVSDVPPETVVNAPGTDGSDLRLTLADLADTYRIVDGEKITYVTDAAPTEENFRKIVSFAAGSDYFFVEATFSDEEHQRAVERKHLTALTAGRLAREAGAARAIPFHFSPRYQDREEMLRGEVERGFAGGE